MNPLEVFGGLLNGILSLPATLLGPGGLGGLLEGLFDGGFNQRRLPGVKDKAAPAKRDSFVKPKAKDKIAAPFMQDVPMGPFGAVPAPFTGKGKTKSCSGGT